MKKNDSYYGGFFWVSLVSFVVPLFVAYSAFSTLTPTTKPTPNPDASGVDHNLWDYLLRTYVENGLVDYHGLSKDYLFKTYLQQIASADPTKLPTADEKLALHCNAYNALVMNGVIVHKIHQNEKNVLQYTPKPAADKLEKLEREIAGLKRQPQPDPARIAELTKKAEAVKAKSQFFRIEEHLFANETISLDHLEQTLIRPVFNEPRIHVALVCAAKSCPAIRPEAYIGERIQAQLEDQATQFANNDRYVSYDSATNSIGLSPLLKWYSQDWDAAGGYVTWLESLTKSPTIKEKLAATKSGAVTISFKSYDWSLNSQTGSPGAGIGGAVDLVRAPSPTNSDRFWEQFLGTILGTIFGNNLASGTALHAGSSPRRWYNIVPQGKDTEFTTVNSQAHLIVRTNRRLASCRSQQLKSWSPTI